MDKNLKNTNLQFMFATHLWHWNKSHQTWNHSVDPEEDYYLAKNERSRFHGVPEKANLKYFFQIRKYIEYLPLIHLKVPPQKNNNNNNNNNNKTVIYNNNNNNNSHL